MQGFVHVDALHCPRGHHIRADAFFPTDGGVRCKFRYPETRQECGALLYVAACASWRTPETGPRLLYAVEVTFRELQQIHAARLGVLEVLELFGATFPAVRRPPEQRRGRG